MRAARAPRPDPEVRRLLLQMSVLPPAPFGRPTVDRVRRSWQLVVKAFASRERVTDVTEVTIPGPEHRIVVRAYRPSGPGPHPVLVWFHGGGFVFGDLYTAGATARALANRSGALVVTVGYRLAPEHPLEAGRADCLAAIRWVSAHADRLGGARDRIAVGGDSAGGGIAALVAQECSRHGPALRCQLLVYPATDLTGSHPSSRESMPGLLTPAWTDWIRSRIGEVTDLHDPASSAIRTHDLAGTAPAVVLTAGFDPLRDEGVAYVERLRAADVPVHHLHYPGQIHGFVSMDQIMSGARDALDRLGDALARALAGRPGRADELDLPPHRHHDRLLWLHPRQRWNELVVAAVLVRDWLSGSVPPAPPVPPTRDAPPGRPRRTPRWSR